MSESSNQPHVTYHIPPKGSASGLRIVCDDIEYAFSRKRDRSGGTLEAAKSRTDLECPEEAWSPNTVFLDVETGGLDPARNALLQVGMWYPYAGLETEFYVKDSAGAIDSRALEVNNLALSDVLADGLEVEAAAKAVVHFIDKARQKMKEGKGGRNLYMVGHNVAFDLAFMRRLFLGSDIRTPKELLYNRYLDTHTLLFSRGAPTSLSSAADYYRVPVDPSTRHTALADAKIAGELFWILTR